MTSVPPGHLSAGGAGGIGPLGGTTMSGFLYLPISQVKPMGFAIPQPSVRRYAGRAHVARLLFLDVDPELARLLVVRDRLLQIARQRLAVVSVVELAEAQVGQRMAEARGI